jgi:hypothetical protein
MFYVENYVGCTLAIGHVKQACTETWRLYQSCALTYTNSSFSHLWKHMVNANGILKTVPYRIPFSRPKSRFPSDQCKQLNVMVFASKDPCEILCTIVVVVAVEEI